ncbi:MAG: Chromosome partition protein smc [Parcubacteria bacterium RAAC4_OD1_1]|nr:MAG: Chromosome partition protein smc [Parcubacteria bacterium RAAC4_OD1_1]
MTLKSIELFGFKSFGKKSIVNFTTPITAVVGPNGSGKSNIVEAIRFVLGEQSMKSLRGKGGSDLIFKGSKGTPSSSRASVVITFDNSKKIFSFTSGNIKNSSSVSLDYDEVSIGREVFPDGVNKYTINGTEVRLKDILDLLSSVNIGSSGHHIISQGEADHILNASNKDRRGMIEDALGLRVYQYRIKESTRKLEKTLLNIKEVGSLRREIAPHLAFLKKQVGIIEKAKEMRDELNNLYRDYISSESTYIKKETDRLNKEREYLDNRGRDLDERISQIKNNKEEKVESPYHKDLKEKEEELRICRSQKGELSHRLGRIEGVLESIEREISNAQNVKERVITESEWKSIVSEIEFKINEAIEKENLPEIIEILRSIKIRISSLSENKDITPKVNENILKEYEDMKKLKEEILENVNALNTKEKETESSIFDLREKERQNEISLRDNERVLYELLGEKNKIVSDTHSLSFEEEKLGLIKSAFEMELVEGGVLIGRDIMSFTEIESQKEVDRKAQEDLRKKIERIKIKLEDVGGGGGGDVLKEYEETKERDEFLEKETEDLNNSIKDCQILIQELKETLDKEFKEGVEKINKQFQEFFSLMFGGGSAFLAITMEHKKVRKDEIFEENEEDYEEDEDEIKENDTELGFERGIEINVSLPQKKVKDLHMLSGGERSLTSIALLFAISQVNPPPFLVLDETDAALDEANSRKYGNMLENLSKYSELIVVTHNRETMSCADVLYGVTMGAEGVSKLLSIHLEDATLYAK